MLTEQQKKYHCREVNSGLGVNREKDIREEMNGLVKT